MFEISEMGELSPIQIGDMACDIPHKYISDVMQHFPMNGSDVFIDLIQQGSCQCFVSTALNYSKLNFPPTVYEVSLLRNSRVS